MSIFSADYLTRKPQAIEFLRGDFQDPATRKLITNEAAALPRFAAVYDALSKSHTSDAAKRNIEILSKPGSVAVVTGQQTGLFLGPLFNFYKTISVIETAKTLEKETGVKAVPVFWLQNEDHDADEIASAAVQSKDRHSSLISIPVSSAKISVKFRLLGSEINTALEQFASATKDFPFSEEVLATLRKYYTPDVSWSDAFGNCFREIFAEEGLLVFDSRSKEVAEITKPLMLKAFTDADAISKALQARNEALEKLNYSSQVHIRDGSPLPFYHVEKVDGERFRLLPAGGKDKDSWKVAGGDRILSKQEVIDVVSADPLRASTSALIRPIFQDVLFPTALYVAGLAEINYGAQLQPVYAHMGVRQPLMMPRFSARLIPRRTAQHLADLKISPGDAQAPYDAVLHSLLTQSNLLCPKTKGLRTLLKDGLDELLKKVEDLPYGNDATVQKSLETTRKNIFFIADKLSERYAKVATDKELNLSVKLNRIQENLFPLGGLQERVLSGVSFACHYGFDGLKQICQKNLRPFGTDVIDISLDE